VSHQTLWPAAWLQNYFNAINVVLKCRTLRMFTRIFPAQNRQKNKSNQTGKDKQYSYSAARIISQLVVIVLCEIRFLFLSDILVLEAKDEVNER